MYEVDVVEEVLARVSEFYGVSSEYDKVRRQLKGIEYAVKSRMRNIISPDNIICGNSGLHQCGSV